MHFNFAFQFFTQDLQHSDKQTYIYRNCIIKQLLTSGYSISDVMYSNIYIHQITILYVLYTKNCQIFTKCPSLNFPPLASIVTPHTIHKINATLQQNNYIWRNDWIQWLLSTRSLSTWKVHVLH